MTEKIKKGIIPLKIEETIKESLKKGDVSTMRHSLEVYIEEREKEGMKKGMKEGAKKRAIEIAKNLVAKGKMTVEEIAEATKLSVDDILKLQGEM